MESIAEPTAAGKDVEALERLDRRQGGGRRPAQDVEYNHYYEDIHDDDDNVINVVACDLLKVLFTASTAALYKGENVLDWAS